MREVESVGRREKYIVALNCPTQHKDQESGGPATSIIAGRARLSRFDEWALADEVLFARPGIATTRICRASVSVYSLGSNIQQGFYVKFSTLRRLLAEGPQLRSGVLERRPLICSVRPWLLRSDGDPREARGFLGMESLVVETQHVGT